MSQKKRVRTSMVKGVTRRGSRKRGNEVRAIRVSFFLLAEGIMNRYEGIFSWVGEIAAVYTG